MDFEFETAWSLEAQRRPWHSYTITILISTTAVYSAHKQGKDRNSQMAAGDMRRGIQDTSSSWFLGRSKMSKTQDPLAERNLEVISLSGCLIGVV